MVLEPWNKVLIVVSYLCLAIVGSAYFYTGAVFALIYPYQNIMIRLLQLSNVVMIFSWHEGEGFALQFLWLRFVLVLVPGWFFGRNGAGNSFSPLVLCNLVHCIVLVCPCIKLLDLFVLQLTLEHMIISRKVPMPVQKMYNLHVIIVCGPKSSDCLRIVGQCMIFVCGQVKFLSLGASACLLFGLVTMSLCCKCCCASSMSLSLLWELHSDKHFAHLLELPFGIRRECSPADSQPHSQWDWGRPLSFPPFSSWWN